MQFHQDFLALCRRSCVAAFCLGLALHAAERRPAKPEFRADIVLVGFNSGSSPKERENILATAGARELRIIGQDVHVVKVPAGAVKQTIEVLSKFPAVRYAEPDFRNELNGVPNDPSFPQQWALLNNGQSVNGTTGTAGADESASKAWNITTGSR